MLTEIAAVKQRYERSDFVHPSDESDALLMELIGMNCCQRRVWEARFCGITRQLVDGEWTDVAGERLSSARTAEYLGITEDAVWQATKRAALHLVGVLGRGER